MIAEQWIYKHWGESPYRHLPLEQLRWCLEEPGFPNNFWLRSNLFQSAGVNDAAHCANLVSFAGMAVHRFCSAFQTNLGCTLENICLPTIPHDALD
jgi:hypothetical protein